MGGHLTAHLVDRQLHTQGILGVILEQRVGVGGTVALFVGRVGEGRRGGTHDVSAAGGGGDEHPVAEQLRYQLHEDVPMAVDGTGLVALGAADHDAVGAALHHVDIHIGISLLAGGLGTVALGVGHGQGTYRQSTALCCP